MTSSICHHRRTAIAACLILLTGCFKASSAVGDADVTLKFWNELNQREDFSDVQAAIGAWAFTETSERAQSIRTLALFDYATAMLNKRNQQLASLQMKDVDPALLDYTAKLAALNSARISALTEAKAVLSQVQDMTDPGRLGLDLFGSLLRHSKDKDPLAAMFQEQFFEKAQSLGDALPKARAVASQVATAQKLESDMETAEVAARVSLHKNHDREFPPASSYTKKAPTSAEGIFTRRRLILDALGQKVGTWTFDALEEIRSFEITKRSVQGDKAAMEIKCMAIGKYSGQRYDLDFSMTYEKRGDAWVLVGLTPAQ